MVTTNDLPEGEAQPPEPQSSGPAPSLDEATIGDLIEKRVKDLFAKQRKEAPAAPAAEGPDVGKLIEEALAKAMAERDKEDQVFVLQQEIDALKEQFKHASPERKRGWGSYILGPGLSR
jgi:hypothetical protein